MRLWISGVLSQEVAYNIKELGEPVALNHAALGHVMSYKALEYKALTLKIILHLYDAVHPKAFCKIYRDGNPSSTAKMQLSLGQDRQ